MRYPDYLPKGGTIHLVAPSFGCAIEPYRTRFENAKKLWRRLGYELKLGPNCYAADGVGISNTPKLCAKEWMEAYLDEESNCLISCGGGELMCEILEYIDFERLAKAKPKWFMGYSDNTNLTYLLATLCDTASVYGPCAPAFGREPWHASLADAMNILTGESHEVSGYEKWELEALEGEEDFLAPYHVTQPRVLNVHVGDRLFEKGSAEEIRFQGRLLGGCMDCLVNLPGTRFDRTEQFVERYREDGIIWFLEACDMNPFDVRRAMWRMEQAGWFEHVKGFLIGRPRLYGQEIMGLDFYDAILNVAGKKNVPVIMDIDLGHLPPMMPIVTGAVGEVRVKDNHIRIRNI